MKNKAKLSIAFLTSITASVCVLTSLTSCSSTSQVNTYSYVIDTSDFNEFKSLTATSLLTDIANNNTKQTDALLAVIAKSISNQTQKEFAFSSDAYFTGTYKKKYNNTNPTRTTLQLEIKDGSNLYVVDLENMFTFASSGFIPPTQYTYVFDQLNLSTIENTSYLDIDDASWTSAFNSTNNNGYVIPPTVYVIKSKTYRQLTNSTAQYVIVYSVDSDYLEQINGLPNASSFRDITVTVNLSPYLDKQLQTEFTLTVENIKTAFGANATLQTVQSMQEVEVFNKLKTYVSTLGNIQPLRDCISTTDATKVEGFSRVASITNSNQLIIKFKSNANYINGFNYSFVLNFA